MFELKIVSFSVRYNFQFIDKVLKEATEKEAMIERRKDVSLTFPEYDDSFVLPSKDLWVNGKCLGGVVDKDKCFVMSSAWHEGARCDKYDFTEDEVEVRDERVIYLGFLNSCWGHAITDNLKKLWFVGTESYKELIEKGYKVVYITEDNKSMPKYVWRLFELCGVDCSMFEHIVKVTRFKNVVVPDNSFIADNGERYYTDEYKRTIDVIKSNAALNTEYKGKKIYFSRTGTQTWRETGEKAIEKVFESLGYVILHPERFSVDTQISIVSSCKAFASTEGSISHNAVFCAPNTPVTIIRKVHDVNKYQMALNAVADVDVTYIDAHHSINAQEGSPWVGPFYLCVNRNVERYVGHRIMRLPLLMRCSWWNYYLSKYQLYNRICNKIKRTLHGE